MHMQLASDVSVESTTYLRGARTIISSSTFFQLARR